MHIRRITTGAAAAALALLASACSDGLTAPAAHPAARALTTSASRPTLIPNTVRYRDTGGQPATGRSGSAVLRAYALLAKDGVTELQLNTYPVNPGPDPWSPVMKHVQIKGLDVDSSVMFVQHLRDLDELNWKATLGGLSRGQSLRVQANVTDLDPHRTDVVTVTERVKLRPDLSVQLEVPAQVAPGQPVPINAIIRELNGDVGNYGDCVLLVNGSVADWGYMFWVDAGDAVTCAFTYTFPHGTHDVQARITQVYRPDWDESNNASEVVRVQTVGGPTNFAYSAAAYSIKSRYSSRQTSQWHNPTSQRLGESEWEAVNERDTEYASIGGFIQRGFTGPFSVELSQSTGGRVVHADAWTEPGEGCTWRWGGTADVFLCSYGSGGYPVTQFNYTRNAGTVTYHSRNFAREWDEFTGEETYYYHFNVEQEQDFGPLAGMRDDYAFSVKVTDGNVVLTADSRFRLRHSAWSSNFSYCYPYTDPWNGFTSESCVTNDNSYEEWYGQDWSGG